jgi:hypothetical protein
MIVPFSDPSTIGLRAHIEVTLWRVKHLHMLDKASINELSMRVLIPKMRERDIVKTAGHLMRLMGSACGKPVASPVFMDPKPCEICPIPPRVFLSAIMLVSKPDKIIDSMDGALEVAVLQSAKAMLEMVDSLAPQLVVFPYLNAGVVLEAFNEFNSAYHAWKQADDARATGRIARALIALYTALAEFPIVPLNVQPADARIRGELITQIRRLRSIFAQLNSAEDLVNFDRSLDYILGNNILVHRTLLLLA